MCRKGETNKVWFRSERVHVVGRDYFFSTREGVNIGPYGNRKEAVNGAERYIEELTLKNGTLAQASQVATDGVWASTNFQ